ASGQACRWVEIDAGIGVQDGNRAVDHPSLRTSLRTGTPSNRRTSTPPYDGQPCRLCRPPQVRPPPTTLLQTVGLRPVRRHAIGASAPTRLDRRDARRPAGSHPPP